MPKHSDRESSQALPQIAARLKAARLRLGVSQMQLGVLAGIDEFSASARMNQYERGKHVPDLLTLQRLAQVLQVPLSYFFTETDEETQLVLAFYGMKRPARRALLSALLSGSLRPLPNDAE